MSFTLKPGDSLYAAAERISALESIISDKDRDIENLNLTLQEKVKIIGDLELKATTGLQSASSHTLLIELISRNDVFNNTVREVLMKLYAGM